MGARAGANRSREQVTRKYQYYRLTKVLCNEHVNIPNCSMRLLHTIHMNILYIMKGTITWEVSEGVNGNKAHCRRTNALSRSAKICSLAKKKK